jgi:SNF2 family DNA or RNA helicase
MPELYAFQQRMVDKALSVSHFFCGDDMGVGKTVEAVALDKARRELIKKVGVVHSPLLTLVVAPMSMATAWEDHFRTWNPTLRVARIYPEESATNQKNIFRSKFLEMIEHVKADVFICHWESLRLMPELRKTHWFHIIADEAHRAKNRKAQQTHALKRLPTMHKLALTGTPADNRPTDIWSILNWLYPRTWTSYWNFERNYVRIKAHNVGVCNAAGCDGYHRNAYREIVGVANPREFRQRISPYYIRRLKEDPEVGLELPEKIHTTIKVDLLPQQRRAYEQMRKNMLAWIGEHENEPIAAPIVVAQLVRLQQFAGGYGQLEAVKVRDKDTGELTTKMVLRLTEPSSKLDAMMELISDHDDKQFVVFSQSRQLMELLAARLERSNISHCLFTGNTPQGDRGRLVAEFQSGRRRVFAGTVSAGGVGLTLTAASVLLRPDRHPSPAVNKQAEDRLHRIGQKNNVQIIDIVANNTLDQQRIDQIEMKWQVIKQLLGE